MTLDFLQDYLVLVVVGICLCVGFIIKKIDCIPNKFIPLISGLLGLLINIWTNGWCEQGGYVPTSCYSQWITFHKPFINLDYTFQATAELSTTLGANGGGLCVYVGEPIQNTCSKTGLSIQTCSHFSNYYWEAKGFVK